MLIAKIKPVTSAKHMPNQKTCCVHGKYGTGPAEVRAPFWSHMWSLELADMWLEGNPLHPQSLVPMLRHLASEHPADLTEIGLDADQVSLVLQDALCV